MLNLQLVQESYEDVSQELDIELFKQAPLQKYDRGSKVIMVTTQNDLVKAMKHMSEQEWIGVDMEHSKG